MDDAALLEDAPATVAATDSDALYEEIDGRRVEMPPMSTYATQVTNRLTRRMGEYAESHGLGEVFGEMLFKLSLAGRTRNRRPDVAFVSYQRWPRERPVDPVGNAWEVVPELMVEVVSPTDLADELLEKVLEYFEAGAKAVWVIYPVARYALVYDSPKQVRGLTAQDALDGGMALPGFTLPLTTLFGPPTSPTA
jgi:Uma2 family endonuclease